METPSPLTVLRSHSTDLVTSIPRSAAAAREPRAATRMVVSCIVLVMRCGQMAETRKWNWPWDFSVGLCFDIKHVYFYCISTSDLQRTWWFF